MVDARTTSIHDLPDDLLEAILLRVSSPVCLARAGAACKLWRRVIAGDRFAARFRSMHAPAVAVYYSNSCRSFRSMAKPWTSIRPSFDPSPSTATGIDPRNFSLHFLSDDVIVGLHRATVLDSRGGLVLIEFDGLQHIRQTFPDELVVCEPLTRRKEKIPRPRGLDDGDCMICIYGRSYLVDAAGEASGFTISMSSFRVLCDMEKAIDHVSPKVDHTRRILGRAGGSWYFYIKGMTWIVLDGSTGEYSSSDLPTTVDWGLDDHTRMYGFSVTDGCDGIKPRIIKLLDLDNTVKMFARLGGNGDEWALEKWHLYLWAQGPGFIIVALEVIWTMELKPAAEEMLNMLYRCTLPCPPALRVCLDEDR
ncbi:hypothetical protein SETIT_6G138600v2 [Setaria italica]|uniref:F-box domain-containing protein n=1 Tax=Setaria italica TaxID=4555 RepID=A0A368RLJ9_SETIT|nr:hypothetical protein SETIT_6G138600v2 [Setaria italica]